MMQDGERCSARFSVQRAGLGEVVLRIEEDGDLRVAVIMPSAWMRRLGEMFIRRADVVADELVDALMLPPGSL